MRQAKAAAKKKTRRRACDPILYGQMLIQILPGVIESEKENERYLKIVRILVEADERSPEEDRIMSLLVSLIDEYERREYKPKAAKPREVLSELMLANGLKQKDLLDIFKFRSIISQFLNGRRSLSKEHIKALAERFHTSTDIWF